MKKAIAFLLFLTVFLAAIPSIANIAVYNEAENTSVNAEDLGIKAKSFVLMEAETGEILLSGNDDYYESPASVTKIMTLLLVCEALRDGRYKLSDTVNVSEYASSMGGSQVFLKEGEKMTVEELLKCTVIASANDAAVALAELTEGSEQAFVAKMNERAVQLGLKMTSFENATGLDDNTVNHYSCARDIAIMSAELIKYDIITKYASLWQDSIRDGEFVLTNTNRLVRFYEGCNGLKTGSTDKAGYCISVTAKRGDMQLIAVIMNSDSITDRNSSARALLDYGFSNYAVYSRPEADFSTVPVRFGVQGSVALYADDFSAVTSRGDIQKIEAVYDIPDHLVAPVSKGQAVGRVTYRIGDEIIGEANICAGADVARISYFGVFLRILKSVFI